MVNLKKLALAIVALAMIAAGAVAASKYDNSKVSEADGAEIRSMAATRTPTPTPTEAPTLTRLIATYKGKEVIVGDEVSKADIDVKGIYFNGRSYTTVSVSNYEILDPVIYDTGINEITLELDNVITTINVRGKEPLEIVSITATYAGGPIIVSNPINKSDVRVYAHYNWTDKSPDLITNFRLEPDVIQNIGTNTIEVWYGYLDPVTITVTGIEKKVTKMEVTYIGDPVYVGDYVGAENFEVVLTFNDGSESLAENFRLTGDLISSEGVNKVTVSYQGFIKAVEVQGIARPSAIWDDFPYDNSSWDTSSSVTLLVSRDPRAQSIEVKYVDWKEIDACVNRVFYTSNYLGFEVVYSDPDAIFEFPMPCRVRRPEEFPAENFAIYYSPNKETITARVTGEFIGRDDDYFVFTMEEPGTYIFVDIAEGRHVSSINVKDKDLRLRVNRNYSLEPVVLPETAGNREVSYYSTDENVATVSERGKIKTIAPGECEIYIQAMDGSDVFEVVHITVTEK